jgi:hypothetical protein
VLLQAIGRRVGGGVENMRNREANSLSAGLALGMVVLGESRMSGWWGKNTPFLFFKKTVHMDLDFK